MDISASQVKELREITGAGMMDCKKALVEAKGDLNAAVDAMRKSGVAKALKKAGRTAAEGIVVKGVRKDNLLAVIIEINCETDFVGRDQHFREFSEKVAAAALAGELETVDALALAKVGDKTIEQLRQELVIQLGENIQLRRIALMRAPAGGVVGAYTHNGRMAAMVAITQNDAAFAEDLAMHVVANNPQALKAEDVPAELVAKEREIFIAQSAESGKPADIVEKMVEGRIRKFLSEVSLVEQGFVKDPDQIIKNILKSQNTEIISFVRFEVGEGIEKQTEDFAQAVMAQVSGEH